MVDQPRKRFPASVYDVGDEPDVRFTLANERTFLAWLRTALAMIAGGVALEAFGLDIHPGFRLAAAIVLIVAGMAAAALAWVSWMRTERALRKGAPLPSSLLAMLVGATIVAVGVLVLLGIFLR